MTTKYKYWLVKVVTRVCVNIRTNLSALTFLFSFGIISSRNLTKETNTHIVKIFSRFLQQYKLKFFDVTVSCVKRFSSVPLCLYFETCRKSSWKGLKRFILSVIQKFPSYGILVLKLTFQERFCTKIEVLKTKIDVSRIILF